MKTLNSMINHKVIVRTFSAGCWFGQLAEKSGAEVILHSARRMWQWKAKKGISLSACAIHGIDYTSSKIVEAVPAVWLEAIEIILCSDESVENIESAPDVPAE